MSHCLKITGGRVHDPANGIDGLVRDVFIVDGRVVAQFTEQKAREARTINAAGMIVMPGAVDIHCHIASSSVNRARAMQGEEHASHVHRHDPVQNFRGGTGVLTPSTFTTGYRYASLGYTTAIEAAVSPSGAAQTHFELQDTPNLDAGFLLLMGNHQRLIDMLDRGDDEAAIALATELLRVTGAFGIKVVNPGGVASWRSDAAQMIVNSIDDSVAQTRVTPRKILTTLATVAERLHLPHPPHVHCNRLGQPGNVTTTLETMRAFENRRVHLTHLQFHAYAKNSHGSLISGAAQLCDYINAHPNVTADVGQVMFGDAFTLSADTPLEYTLWKLTGKVTRPYFSIEGELEAGCGAMPFTFSDKQYLHAMQWAIGMELMLLCNDPWRMLLSTDHPNGASFLTYPRIIAALMSKSVRDDMMRQANPRAMARSGLKDITREMSLQEIAVITRAGPARALGLSHKGHLGHGADADVTIYDTNLTDPQRMFEIPRFVIKSGRVLVEEAQLRASLPSTRFRSEVPLLEQGRSELRRWVDDVGSVCPEQFGLHTSELAELRTVHGPSAT